jgi:hypothetical protein
MDATNNLEIPKREAWLRIGRFAIPVFLGFVVLSVLGIYLWPREARDPLKTAYEKIEEGMSAQEVREIVERIDVPAGTITTEEYGSSIIIFDSDQGKLIIISSDGLVEKKEYHDFTGKSLFHRVRRWLGL